MTEPSPRRDTPQERRQERRRRRNPPRSRLLPETPPGSPVAVAHPVIAGYNGSAAARSALAYAAGVARRLNRPLLIVYVTSPGAYCAIMGGQAVESLRVADRLERWLLTEFDQAADPVGLDVHVRTRFGSPAHELAAIAAEFGADALVVGTSKRFWHHWSGSLPARLARRARCPVIVVP